VLQKAIAHHRVNQFQDAERLYRAILQADPDHADANHNLGVLALHLGQSQAALPFLHKAIEINPEVAQFWISLTTAQIHSQQADAARHTLTTARQRGITGKAINKLEIRLSDLQSSKGSNPNPLMDKPSHSVSSQLLDPPQDQINTLVTLYNSRQMTKAEQACKGLLAQFPDSVIVLNFWGAVLRGQNRLHEAVMVFDKAIQLKPNYAEAYNNKGITLKDLGKHQEALDDYSMAIQLKPDYAEAYNNRGVTLKDLDRHQEALDDYGMAIQLKPDYAEAYNNRGITFKGVDRHQEALENFDAAIRLKHVFAAAYNNKGGTLRDLGRVQEALINFEKAIEYNPDYTEAYRNVSTLKKFKADDNQIGIMESLLEKDNITSSDQTHLFFALHKAYEDIADYDKSFQLLKKGNELRKKELNYNIDKDRNIISRIKLIFNKKIKTISPGNDSLTPVFIIGMLRSGTTLVEQILASHTKIYGAGELSTMEKLARNILSRYSQSSLATNNTWSTRRELKQLHYEYIESLTALNVPERIITDKMPQNFLWTGFLLTAFPKAKIINVNRDSRATCWSIYKHYFSEKGNGYAYDMVTLTEYYKLYVDLMAFWRNCFPSKIYNVCYEDLTENQEDETRRLLSFCDLPFEDQCLDFHKTQRVVQTASAVQVRKKMYKGSSEAWRNYEKHIQPMIRLLSGI